MPDLAFFDGLFTTVHRKRWVKRDCIGKLQYYMFWVLRWPTRTRTISQIPAHLEGRRDRNWYFRHRSCAKRVFGFWRLTSSTGARRVCNVPGLRCFYVATSCVPNEVSVCPRYWIFCKVVNSMRLEHDARIRAVISVSLELVLLCSIAIYVEYLPQ